MRSFQLQPGGSSRLCSNGHSNGCAARSLGLRFGRGIHRLALGGLGRWLGLLDALWQRS